MRASAIAYAAVLLAVLATPSAHAEKSMVDTIKKAAISGATSKPIEMGVKIATGLIYRAACPAKPEDKVGEFLCGTLGSVSGKEDEDFKKKVEEELKKISGQLDKLDKNVDKIQNTIERNHKVSEAQFEQAAAKVVATKVIVRIENLWDVFQKQVDPNVPVNANGLRSFADEVIAENLHTKLGDLNVVLTKPTLDGQSMIRYPFHMWRLKKGHMPHEAFDAREAYDFAEQKFMYYRGEQQKGYLVYLWAAEILESQCEVKPEKCRRPPVSSKDFKVRFDDYQRQQLIAFNASVDWLILAYAGDANRMRSGDPRFLPGWPLAGNAEEMFLRANLLTSTVASEGKGLWGRVISMGNKWDGSLEVQCGSRKATLKPALTYPLKVSDKPTETLDWWTSDNADRVYNQVRFASEWTMHHYEMPDAPAGKCTVNAALPNRAGMLPWIEPGTEVVTLASGQDGYAFGSFLAIQRAGGGYALASGEWKRRGEPHREESGSADRVDVRFNWKIEPSRQGGAWAGLWSSGRGKYYIGRGSRVHTYNQIYLYNAKKITFPEDSQVRLNLIPSSECLDLCDGGGEVLLEYDIENDNSDKGKGSLDAHLAVFFDSRTGVIDPTANAKNNLSLLNVDNGIHINASYGKTGDRKTHRTAGEKSGIVKVSNSTGYHLQYLIEFQAITEGRGIDATTWNYKAKITPWSLFLTR